MKRLPERVSFDPEAFVEINRKRNRDFLEFLLAEFQVVVSFFTVHPYLLGKAYLGKDLENEVRALGEAYTIVYPTKELLLRAIEIEARLIKRGIFLSFDDILIGVTAIENNALLVSSEPSRYKPLEKYGLNVMGLNSFFDELRELAREEAAKWEVKPSGVSSPERE